MKSQFIVELSDGQAVLSHFLVREKEVRTSARTGSSWLQLELTDRTGTISAKMWDNFAVLVSTFERDDVVLIRGRVKLYNGQKELTLEQIIPALESEYELVDFLPHTKYDVAKLYEELRAAIGGMQDPWLQRLLLSMVDDPAIAPKLKRAPAAMTMHHAYLGGLLEHVVSMMKMAAGVAANYPELNPDLLLAGVVLHDIGKTEELRYGRAISYSTEGRLLGHITMGIKMVHEKISAIPGFPEPLAALVEHLIVSHHGSLEFGSPALPQTPEALALHFIDDLDSKMASVRATMDSALAGANGDHWTDRNPALRRAMLRADKFAVVVADAPPKSSQPSTAASTTSEREAANGSNGSTEQLPLGKVSFRLT
jgi:3'-5' exoribonuclease